MAATLRSFFYTLLILNLLGEGSCQCSLESITVSQDITGNLIEGKVEYNVTVSNNCPCTQLSVTMKCPGFASVESIDPSILTMDGNIMTLAQPLFGSQSVSFNYAWATPFSWTLASSQIACS